MKTARIAPFAAMLPLCALALVTAAAPAQQTPAAEYYIYAGNTHSHTMYTWSHGEQYLPNYGCGGILVYGSDAAAELGTWTKGYVPGKGQCPTIYVIDSWQYPSQNNTLRKDWQIVQGPPSVHYALAKKNGFDFYVTSDHSQEYSFDPPGPENPAWLATKREAAAATDSQFVALAGFEFSENNGPGGTGHINVINSANILNALAPGIDLPYLYKWLETAAPNGAGPVVASFNHPSPDQYNNWAYRTPGVTNIITMLEVINSNNHIHYEGFINALDKGWKVSPVSGLDNHGLTGISKDTSRTFVLAKDRTKAAILEAMKNRRTYASLDRDIQCRYTVNGKIMGSTLDRPKVFNFHISISDPDTNEPGDKITKIDIVTDGGAVVKTYDVPVPGYSVEWSPQIANTQSKYFFVRVWNAGGGDAPGADPGKPIAWLSPVWTGR
jgi:hypothetical protein